MADCFALTALLCAAMSLARPLEAGDGRALVTPLAAAHPRGESAGQAAPGHAVARRATAEGQDPPADPAGPAAGDDVRFVWRTGPSLRVGRKLRVDFRVKVQTDARRSDQDLDEAGGTLDFPRRRFGIKGHVFQVVEFEVERDLAEDGVWRDVYLNLRPFDVLQAQVGKFKVPFSLDQLTGATDLDFLYRSLAAETLAPNRDVGVMVHGHAWRRAVAYQVGTFRGDGENAPAYQPPPLLPGETVALPSERSVAGRVTMRPLAPLAPRRVAETLEVGVSAMRSEVPEGPNHLQGRTIFGTRFFSRGFYIQGPRTRVGIDVSWSPGPASVRGEYIRVEEARRGVGVGDESGLDNELPSLPARGWYVSGTWAITGEKKAGGLRPRRPFPTAGIGAVEVAARYETLRFGGGDSGQPPSSSPRAANAAGNAEAIVTLGVNWYLNRFVKAQVNGIREQVEDVATSPVPGRASVWTLAFRLQFVL